MDSNTAGCRGRPVFRFAVVADTHVNATDEVSDSPWVTNRLSNARTRHVVELVNAERPDFVVHLGDMVHPVPAMPGYAQAADRFWSLMERLEPPLHLVGGNHDMGDKPLDWVPAEKTNHAYLKLYRQHFGPDHYSFDHGGHHFVVANSQLMNSGLEAEAKQREWLADDLVTNSHKRIFFFSHYPPYLMDPTEPEHYDNIGEPARAWLLELLERFQVEALFTAHVHNFFYNKYGGTQCYVLPSTSFVRHDYSELFRVSPTADFGRDDGGKLGFTLVEVYEEDHVAHVIRTHGKVPDPTPQPRRRLPYTNVKRDGPGPLGVDMRLPWAEVVEIPYSGGLDEFSRKSVRNDYPLLALWEMGIGKLRVPLGDLLTPARARRMRDLADLGHSFHVFCYDIPEEAERETLIEHANILDRVELILPLHLIPQRYDPLTQLHKDTGLPLHYSPLLTSADAEHQASQFTHFIKHGFSIHDDSALQAIPHPPFDGLTFRVPLEQAPWPAIHTVAQLTEPLDLEQTIHVCLADNNPARDHADDHAIANRVAETLTAAWCADPSRTHVFLDTFTDLDRGYFPRHGLVDRHYNPRLAGSVYRNLHTALRLRTPLRRGGEPVDLSGARVYPIEGDGLRMFLVLPQHEFQTKELKTLTAGSNVNLIDLASGTLITDPDLTTMTCSTPMLLQTE